jgi:hypothetical protein
MNQITLHFAEECPGRGSEDIKKEYNGNCFDFFFFSVLLMNVMSGKITINTKELHTNRRRRNTRTSEKKCSK